MKITHLPLSPAVFIFSFFMLYACSSGSAGEDKVPGLVDHGVLKVDNNGRYFVFEDGTPYVPVGLNHFLLYRRGHAIDSMMRIWSEHGVNYLRIWAGLGADPETAVGQFDEKQMQALDSVIYYCTKYGIYLNISFWNENCIREQKGSWGWNGKDQIYNREHHELGTTTDAEDMKDTLHTETWAAMKNRYRNFVERWKDEPIIIMWDLVNDSKKTNAWKTGMYDFVKKIDGSGRIITFQYNTGVDPKGETDCGSVRVYGYNPKGNDPETMMDTLAYRIKQAMKHGDPVYVGEGGMDYPEGSEYAFERGFLHFLWAPLAVGAAGNMHPWVSPPTWPELSLKKLEWIRGFSDFCSTVNWSEFNSKNVDGEVKTDRASVKSFACRDNDEILFYLMNDDPSDTFSVIQTQLKLLSQMDEGKYEVKWIDIRTGKPVRCEKISEFPAEISAPEFMDGIFGYVRKN